MITLPLLGEFPIQDLNTSDAARVIARDRVGADVCPATVTEVLLPPSFDRTAVVRITVPVQHLYTVRNFRTEAGQ